MFGRGAVEDFDAYFHKGEDNQPADPGNQPGDLPVSSQGKQQI